MPDRRQQNMKAKAKQGLSVYAGEQKKGDNVYPDTATPTTGNGCLAFLARVQWRDRDGYRTLLRAQFHLPATREGSFASPRI